MKHKMDILRCKFKILAKLDNFTAFKGTNNKQDLFSKANTDNENCPQKK